MAPFLKWAGGKRQIADFLRSFFPKRRKRYFEPFLGAGTMLLTIQPKEAFVGDLNENLINLWLQVKNNPRLLLTFINWLDATEPVDNDRYLQIRDEYNLLKGRKTPAMAAAMLWLNKHCYNGLYRVNGYGNFNVPWDKKDSKTSIDPSNILEISRFLNLNNIDIEHRNYKETCATATKGDFVYFDPPYDPLSLTAKFTSYTAEKFGTEDQEELAAFFKELSDRGVKVMLSNNDTPLIRKLYGDFIIKEVLVRRSINRKGQKRKGKEIIVMNYDFLRQEDIF